MTENQPLSARLESILNAYSQSLENPPKPAVTESQPQASYAAAPEVPVPAAVTLQSVPGSRLEQLLASYESVKAAYEEAQARMNALTDALKAEMSASAPQGTQEILLTGPPGLPQLRMRWQSPYRFDVKRFRNENPALYVQYETRGGHWEIRQWS